MKLCKVVVYVPQEAAPDLLQGVAQKGFGRQGNYDSWSITGPVTERFRPLKGAKPALGKINELSSVKSCKVELHCLQGELEALLLEVRRHHPYETPGIEVWKIECPLIKDS